MRLTSSAVSRSRRRASGSRFAPGSWSACGRSAGARAAAPDTRSWAAARARSLLRGVRGSGRRAGLQLATIVGTPGIGKSRLARELLGSLEREARVLVGRCVAYGEGITYLPLAEVVREVAGDDPQRAARRAARRRRARRRSPTGWSRPPSASETQRDRPRRPRGRSAGSSRRSPPSGRSSSSSTTSTGPSRRCSTSSST